MFLNWQVLSLQLSSSLRLLRLAYLDVLSFESKSSWLLSRLNISGCEELMCDVLLEVHVEWARLSSLCLRVLLNELMRRRLRKSSFVINTVIILWNILIG